MILVRQLQTDKAMAAANFLSLSAEMCVHMPENPPVMRFENGANI